MKSSPSLRGPHKAAPSPSFINTVVGAHSHIMPFAGRATTGMTCTCGASNIGTALAPMAQWAAQVKVALAAALVKPPSPFAVKGVAA